MSAEYKLLVVEDNRGDVGLLEEAFDGAGLRYALTLFLDGEKALSYVESLSERPAEEQPDMLLLDLNLPKIGGLAILEALRRSENGLKIPIVVMTSSASPKDRDRAVALNVDRHFVKPIELEDFLKIGVVVKELLEQRTNAPTSH